jgi:hypothetical protein
VILSQLNARVFVVFGWLDKTLLPLLLNTDDDVTTTMRMEAVERRMKSKVK